LVSFAQAEDILERIGQMQMSTSSIWRYTQEVGHRFSAVETQQAKEAGALPVKWITPEQLGKSKPRMGVAMDGTMVHIRTEGWKELKVGTLFEIGIDPTRSQEEETHALQNSYVAYLGGPKHFGDKMWREASQRGWEQALDTQAIGDGASWIWNLVRDHFGYSLQVVDWYHAASHLSTAARLLKKEETAAQHWLTSRKALLYQGHADKIAQELQDAIPHPFQEEDKALQAEATYFRNNYRRMAYLEMREGKWLIGSGTVESAGKQYKQRFCGPGMRWSRSGAEHLLPIRTAILSGCYDKHWRQSQNLPPN